MNSTRAGLILFTLLLATPSPGAARARGRGAHLFKVGTTTRSFNPGEPYEWRSAQTHTLLTTIWYPADSSAVERPQWIGAPESPLFSAGMAAREAKPAPTAAKFPMIVLSHGTGASALMMAWLGTALASHGCIAAAVNHPGNNALEPYTVQGFALWWERATDLSRVIDGMLADPTFGSRIDPGRIGAAGFSLGGFTMIEIAGGIGELEPYVDFCRSPRADGMCVEPREFPSLLARAEELSKSDAEFQAALREAHKSHGDPRIRAVFAIAPALGPAFRPDSLEKISIPVEIVAGGSDTVVPIETSAKYFAAHIPRAKLTIFPGGVGHYTFLASCTEQGRGATPALCADAQHVDREAIHSKTASMALDFFAANLK